ncbi:hypothetical protein MRB53_011142 [Persea americana]|uniref:Uncharacterized protein n=1 Tax=Persea americana TaxID=3435 RepID=A0ACC2LU41_PERAE|nr:hypothetical protein MRB53_011142 [Persea americana]
MESYLNQNFGGVKSKNTTEEALQRWRQVCGFVKNPKRRFRFTANLSKRYEASTMRRTNQIRQGGRVLESPFAVKEAVARFFEDLYSGENVVRPKLDGVSFPSIPQDVQRWLEKEFEEEVARALEDCDGDKAQGLTGLVFLS